ncbi:MAG: DUF6261 family protein [Mediterranea sp.]|jgi:hypothetical protein|nr:DUF6261 family protein [Mediterranea sp.]
MMEKIFVLFFGFYRLKLSAFLDLGRLVLIDKLTPELAQTLGVSKSYGQARETLDRLSKIFQRNPVLLQTEKLTETIAKVRRKMIAFKSILKGILGEAEGERLESAKIVENVVHPCLKNLHHDAQSTLAAYGIEMANVLHKSANLPHLTRIGLKDLVDEISALADSANEILASRGQEEIYRRLLGNATATRRKLEKQLRFLLYSAIPSHYAEATGEIVATFEHTIMEISGALKSLQHLTTHHQSTSTIDNG